MFQAAPHRYTHRYINYYTLPPSPPYKSLLGLADGRAAEEERTAQQSEKEADDLPTATLSLPPSLPFAFFLPRYLFNYCMLMIIIDLQVNFSN